MPDFWRDSGYHLLARRDDGKLVVTDDFLRAYMTRPELAPVDDSCDAERALHAALVNNPREAVSAERLAALADPDARENYGVVLDFRDRLVAAGVVEDCYLGLFKAERIDIPPLFIDQLVHAALRGLLEGAEPLRVRAAELLFRPQIVTLHEGAVLAADREVVEMYAATGGFGDLGRLLAQAQTPSRTVELDVLDPDDAAVYWDREARHDTVIDLTTGRAGLDALARVLETWIDHFTGARVRIAPVASITDERWVWHIGLDAEATLILNDLYNGVALDEARRERLLGLFRLEFDDPSLMRADIAGRPVYLGMAMTEDKLLRLKPQNLLVNLPLAAPA